MTVETVELAFYGYGLIWLIVACIPMRRSFKIASFTLLALTLLAAPWVIR